MGVDDVEKLVYDVKISSVVPAMVTGEDKVQELTNMDLAMKLHYINGVYFFESDGVQGIGIIELKNHMAQWLQLYYPSSGRIRLPEKSRPLIKCNDGGVRIVEATCSRTLDDWLAMKDRRLDHLLVHRQALGPELGFSPLVFVQFTWFKCGGLSVGLTWTHIVGDAFSASAFMNMWGHIAAGHVSPHSLNMPNARKRRFSDPIPEKPLSLKVCDPVGDRWILPANRNCKMEAHSFHVTAKNLENILPISSGRNQSDKPQAFRFLAALIWKSLAKTRGESAPRVVTICSNDCERGNEISSNSQVIGTVEAGFKVEDADLLELAELIGEKMVDERQMIEELVGRENGRSDFIVYGAKLTFVNLEEENIYGLRLRGKKPVFANYIVDGIGDEGVVLVLPGPENGKGGGGDGRTVTAIVPECEIDELRSELRKGWGII